MRSSLAILVLLLLTAEVALAQEADSASASQLDDGFVTFILRGTILTDKSESYALPLSVLEALEHQESLRQLNVAGKGLLGESGVMIEAHFIFSGLQAFRTWYQDEKTQAMLTELNEKSSPSVLDYALQVQRRPPLGASNK